MDIKRVLDASYHDALRALVMGTSAAALARARQRALVKTLASRLNEAITDENTRAYHRYATSSRADFGIDALPWDICICRLGASDSGGRQAQSLEYVAGALWQVAIDFSGETAGALQAVNRLAFGGASNKLLLLAHPESGSDSLLESLAQPFAGDGARCLALLPHPRDWDDATHAPAAWQWQNDGWRELT